jgi:hypothetical protein
MQTSMLDHDPFSDSAVNATQPDSPEESADQFGIRLSLLILSIGLFMAAVWPLADRAFANAASWKVRPSATLAMTISGMSKQSLRPKAPMRNVALDVCFGP